MTFPEALLLHAWELFLSNEDDERLNEVELRGAVSGAYYSLFHQMNADAARLLAPNVSDKINNRIQRWFNHAETKTNCGRFLPAKLSGPLQELIGEASSADMQTVARNFIELQAARHRADYDFSYKLTSDDAVHFLRLADQATDAWRRLAGTAEANIFILSLLLWKNWDRERL